MILTALEMQGFKSFPDKTKLVFNRGITAVVGPNGSGKSNISDAVRWVLGEQSSKSLRGSRMEDVIFSGTDIRRATGFAEVTLYLDNKDNSLPKDTDEVTVTRRYYRSGESEYLINGETVRLRDVHEMFMDTGLGRDGYSIVSQGKIADMISSRGSERREMFEEAAGISHYRYRRTDALRKLDQAEENLVRLRDILTELEGRVGPLKIQSEKAKKFLVLAEEKKTLEIGLWLCTIERAKQELHKHEDALNLARAQYAKLEAELSGHEQLIEANAEEIRRLTAEIEQSRAQAAALEEQATAVDGQTALLESSVEHNRDTIERIEHEKLENTRDSEEIEKEIEQHRKLIAQLEKSIEAKNNELEEINRSLEAAVQQSASIADDAAQASAEIAMLTKKLSDSRVEASTAASSIEEISTRLETVDELLFARNAALQSAQNEVTSAQTALDENESRIAEASNTVSGHRLIHEKRVSKADELKRKLDDKSFEIQKTESRQKMLEDLEKHMEGYSGSVKAVMHRAQGGALKGIHGPVSQLIEVSEEYAVAIETALGAAVQFIVTDNENDAKHAIRYLKDNNAGRATFLPITAIKGKSLNEDGLEDCYGYIDVATNLMSCDAVYDEIMASLLGKTVVAEDIDSAVAIGKKYANRFKIVTLDGQVINAGGSMTGGSRTQNSGILSRATEIENLKAKLKAFADERAELDKAYKAACTQLAACEAELEGAKGDLANAQEDRIRLEGQLALCKEQFAAARSAVDELMTEKSTAGGRIAMLKIALDSANTTVDEISAQIDEKEAFISQLGEQRTLLDEEREEITRKVTKLNLAVHDARKDIDTKNEHINLLRFRLVNQGTRTEELNAEIQSLIARNEQTAVEIEQMRQKAALLREQSAACRALVESLNAKRDEQEARSVTLRGEERSKSADRENLGGELARLEERREAKLKEYDDTVNKLYDEYELTRREAEQLGIVIEDIKQAGRRLAELKNSIRALGSVNVGAIEEYKEVSERYEFMSGQIEDVEKSKQELLKLIDELTSSMSEQFREEFAKISVSFSETFRELFGGGKAELVLEDPRDVLECNIEIKVQPPGKNVKNIDLLSGGEKGLSAICLLFAILKVNPAPFCIFDEVEAALDEVNVARYAQYVRRMTGNTQFILITHRRGTMEEADVLYGITMQEEGVSKLLELKTAEMAKRLGIG